MVQVENEYGSFACDRNYSKWLRDETLRHVGDKAVLFTNDGPSQTPCGKIENVLATLDFGAGEISLSIVSLSMKQLMIRNFTPGDPQSIDKFWKRLRDFQPNGPLVNSEFYPGWLSHWQEPLARVASQPIVDSLK